MPPPMHKPIDRPYQFHVDVFDPQFRLSINGQWCESPIALVAEVFQTCRLNPQNVALLQPLLRHCLRQCNPELLRTLESISPSDCVTPLPESTNTR